jgi:leucine dehydrogenase
MNPSIYSPPVQLFAEHEQVVVCHEPEVGLRAIIALHDTTLGPGLGGIRMWRYDSDEAALTDVLRLSRGMTYKNAVAGLDLGGGKTVVLGDPRTDKSPDLFRALGRFVDSLGGRYLAAEDVGTSTADAELVALETDHITGLPVERGGSGDPSPMTAWGVFCGMRAALVEAGLGPGFEGIRVAVQGAGHVGAGLVRHLLTAGAEVMVADIYPDRVEPLVELGAATCAAATVHAQDCDVFAPCALGAVIRPDTIEDLRCRVVAGAANNQLLDSAMGDALHARGIVYAPDFVINAGGVINISEELGRPYDAERAKASVERIEHTLTAVYERSSRDAVPPSVAADRLAEERIAAARASRPDAVAALYRPG